MSNSSEFVQISLNRYNDFLDDNKKANLLYDVYNDIRNLVDEMDDNKTFEKGTIESKIFKLYERLVNEIG